MNEWRTIIEETSFQDQYDHISRLFPRLDDIKAGVDFLLARNPTVGEEVFPSHYVFNSDRAGGEPSFSFLYRYSNNPEEDHEVFLISIAIRSDPEDWELDF